MSFNTKFSDLGQLVTGGVVANATITWSNDILVDDAWSEEMILETQADQNYEVWIRRAGKDGVYDAGVVVQAGLLATANATVWQPVVVKPSDAASIVPVNPGKFQLGIKNVSGAAATTYANMKVELIGRG